MQAHVGTHTRGEREREKWFSFISSLLGRKVATIWRRLRFHREALVPFSGWLGYEAVNTACQKGIPVALTLFHCMVSLCDVCNRYGPADNMDWSGIRTRIFPSRPSGKKKKSNVGKYIRCTEQLQSYAWGDLGMAKIGSRSILIAMKKY